MPSLSPQEITTIRNHPHYVSKYLSINPKNSVYSGQLTGVITRDRNSGGIVSFEYTGGAGTLSDVEVDMLIEVGTTPGANDIGKVRVRRSPTVDTIFVNEIAPGELPLEINHYFTVYDLFLPDIKMLRLVPKKKNGSTYFNDFTEFHDYDIAYSTQNASIEPKANITEQNGSSDRKKFPIKFAGFVDNYNTATQLTYRTVTLSADESFAVADGASITGRFWDVKDGTIVIGTDTDSNITVQFPVGFRQITLEVFDSNGRTGLRRVPIWVHDDTYMPIGWRSDGDLQRGFSVTKDLTKDGRSMTYQIFGETNSATEFEIPAGTEVCYWDIAEYNGTAPPEQYRHSFLGWALKDTTEVKQDGGYRLEVGGIEAWLKKLIGFGTQITDKDRTPQTWFEMENISPDKIVHYLLREYTTCIPQVNLFFSGINKDIQSETAKRSSIWTQAREVMQANFALMLADSTNSIYLRKHPSYPLPSDTAPDNILLITSDDWTEDTTITVEERQFTPIGRVDGTGAYWTPGSAEPEVLASRAPGKVVGRSSGSESTPFQRLQGPKTDAQTELNILTGHHFARRNAPTPQLTLNLLGNYDVFEPAWMETITIVYTGDSIRDVGFTGAETFLVTQVTVTHNEEPGNFSKRVQLKLEPVTEGEPGETIIIPQGDWVDNPFWDLFWDVNPAFPEFDFPIDFNQSLDYEFEGEQIGFAIFPIEEQYVARTFSFGNEFVSYDDITPFPDDTDSYVLRSIAAQFNGTNVTCRAVYTQGTTGYVYLTTDAEVDEPTWSLEETFTITGGTFNGAMQITASDDDAQDLWAIAWLTETGIYEKRRFASAWTAATVVNSAAFIDVDWSEKYAGLFISGNTVYIGGRSGSTAYTLYQATNLGAFSAISNTSGIFPHAIADISGNLDGDVYASCYGDTIVNTITPVDLKDNFVIQQRSTAADTTFDATGEPWNLYESDINEDNQRNPQFVEITWFPPSIPSLITGSTLDINVRVREQWWVLLFDLGATYPVSWGNTVTFDFTCEISTNNVGGFIGTAQVTWDGSDQFARGFIAPGPRTEYFLNKTGFFNFTPALPTGEMEINSIKFTGTVTSPDPSLYPFYRGSITAISSPPPYQRESQVIFNVEADLESAIEKPDSRFYRIEDPLGAETVVDILPPDTQFEGAPDRPYQISPDWSVANRLKAYGRVDTGRWHNYESVDKGDTWSVSFNQFFNPRWRKLNNNIELIGQENTLDLQLGLNVEDRLGNLSTLYNLASPYVGPGYVLFAE